MIAGLKWWLYVRRFKDYFNFEACFTISVAIFFEVLGILWVRSGWL